MLRPFKVASLEELAINKLQAASSAHARKPRFTAARASPARSSALLRDDLIENAL
jgi:hypothetical protein